MESQKSEEAKKAEKAAELKKAEEAKKAFEASEKIDVDKKTKGNYVPKVGEKNNYHAKIERRRWVEGEKVSKARVQIFAPKSFANFEKHAASQGYHVDILHDPTDEYPICGVEKLKKAKKKK